MLQLHGWKSPLKDLIKAERSNLHRSFSSKLTSFGIGKIGIHFLASIDNVLYVEGLKYNLLSISQFCYIVSFNKDKCIVKKKYGKSFFIARRHNNLYEINLIDVSQQNVMCWLCREDEKWLWHKRLGHVNLKTYFKTIQK